jgi:hypothetical protein
VNDRVAEYQGLDAGSSNKRRIVSQAHRLYLRAFTVRRAESLSILVGVQMIQRGLCSQAASVCESMGTRTQVAVTMTFQRGLNSLMGNYFLTI